MMIFKQQLNSINMKPRKFSYKKSIIHSSLIFTLISLFLLSACTTKKKPTLSGAEKSPTEIIKEKQLDKETKTDDKILGDAWKKESHDNLLSFLKANKSRKVIVDPQNDAFFVDSNVKRYFSKLIFDDGCKNILTPTQAAVLQGFLAKSHKQSTKATRRDILKFCAERGYEYLLRYSVPLKENMYVTILRIEKKNNGEIVGKVIENMRSPVQASGEKVPWPDSIVEDRSMITKKISDLIDEPMVEFRKKYDKFCDVSGYMHLHTNMDPEQFEHRFKAFLHDQGCGDIPVVKSWEFARELSRDDFTHKILSRPTTYGLEFDIRKERLSGSSDGRAYCMYYLDVKVYDSTNPHTDLSFLNAFMAIDFVKEKKDEAERKAKEKAEQERKAKEKVEQERKEEVEKKAETDKNLLKIIDKLVDANIKKQTTPIIINQPTTNYSAPPKELAVKVDFLYEKDGITPTKIHNGMVLRSRKDHYAVFFSPEQNCYIYVYQVDSSGAVDQIFPNLKFSKYKNPVKKYQSLRIPGNNEWFFLDDVTGEERLYLLASHEPASRLRNLFDNLKNAHNPDDKKVIYGKMRGYLNTRKRGMGGTETGLTHKVKSSSGVSYDLLFKRIASTEAEFIHQISFMHE